MIIKKVLLINPPSALKVYAKAKLKVALPQVPMLSLASLAAHLLKEGHNVNILDLERSKNPKKDLIKKLDNFQPDYVGITFTTPLYYEANEIAKLVKNFNHNIIIIAGGVHPTAFPEDILKEGAFDIIIKGEGEITITELINSKNKKNIKGISYKDTTKIISNPFRELIEDLDTLEFPAWHLYNIKKYKCSKLITKKNPVGRIEPTRGCPYGCIYCGKNIFGRKVRYKSVKRVIDEISYMKNIGFREIQICDDNFAIDIKRAKEICDAIKISKINISWNLYNGVRVDCVDKEFFEKAYSAGCHQTGFGFESGNQTLLNNIHKGITLEQSRKAAKWAKDAGLETVGYFMFGLPGETEKTMKETIEFAKSLDLDYAKVTLMLPFPSTEIYDQLKKQGLIKTNDWSKYNFHTTSEVYDHANLDWDTLHKYYNLFHRKFYFRPSYITKRLIKNIKNGNIIYDFYYFLRTWGPFS